MFGTVAVIFALAYAVWIPAAAMLWPVSGFGKRAVWLLLLAAAAFLVKNAAGIGFGRSGYAGGYRSDDRFGRGGRNKKA